MTNKNPIAALLRIQPVRCDLEILGRRYQYHPAGEFAEAMYRNDAGHGVSNPAFSLKPWVAADRHTLALGQYLSGRRQGVKRAEAEAIVASAPAATTVLTNA